MIERSAPDDHHLVRPEAAKRQKNGQTSTVSDYADAELDFQAQPAVASSYGVFQALYPTALWLKWSVTLPGGQTSQDPKYLFDSDENLKLPEGGSIMVGSARVAKGFLQKTGKILSFAAPELFTNGFYAMFRSYNGDASASEDYADAIEYYWAPLFLPSVPIRFE